MAPKCFYIKNNDYQEYHFIGELHVRLNILSFNFLKYGIEILTVGN